MHSRTFVQASMHISIGCTEVITCEIFTTPTSCDIRIHQWYFSALERPAIFSPETLYPTNSLFLVRNQTSRGRLLLPRCKIKVKTGGDGILSFTAKTRIIKPCAMKSRISSPGMRAKNTAKTQQKHSLFPSSKTEKETKKFSTLPREESPTT